MASYKSYSDVDDIELQRLNAGESPKEGRKLDKSVNFSSEIDINGNKMPKPNKNVQFSTQEVSFENEYELEIKPNLIPNRKREEEQVMENLRKRVGELQLDKNWKRLPKEVKKEEDNEDTQSLVKQVMEQTTDKDFIIDCLCWHNEYRARHNVSAINISMKLCVSAQEWANHLASRNELYYCPPRIFNFGQNIFCCVEASAIPISGQEVATYWYSTIKNYDYFKKPQLLHTNVNTSHFTQIVWKSTRFVGVGKAVASMGKIFVVAFYYPPGNQVGEYHENVLPPLEESRSSSKNESHQPSLNA